MKPESITHVVSYHYLWERGNGYLHKLCFVFTFHIIDVDYHYNYFPFSRTFKLNIFNNIFVLYTENK